jgi:hypothetical protein
MILGDFYHGKLPTLAVQILTVQILTVQILAVQILAVQILTGHPPPHPSHMGYYDVFNCSSAVRIINDRDQIASTRNI